MKDKQFIVTILMLGLIALMWFSIAEMREANYNQICSLEDIVCPGEEVDKEVVSTVVGLTGMASWYDYELDNGWSSVGHYVCASRDFPRKTKLLVTDLSTGKSVNCTVTDYIEHPDRIIDLSSTAFEALKPLKYGLIQEVRVEALSI